MLCKPQRWAVWMKRIKRVQDGFTLVELMIALLIGVIVIGSVISAYASLQSVLVKKMALDAEQDSLRFLTTRIGSMVRNSESINIDNGSILLELVETDELCPVVEAAPTTIELSFHHRSMMCNGRELVNNLPVFQEFNGLCYASDCLNYPVTGLQFLFKQSDSQGKTITVILASRQFLKGVL